MRMLRLVLACKGRRVLEATTPREGLRLGSSLDLDLLIADVFLEGSSGIEVAKHLRQVSLAHPLQQAIENPLVFDHAPDRRELARGPGVQPGRDGARDHAAVAGVCLGQLTEPIGARRGFAAGEHLVNHPVFMVSEKCGSLQQIIWIVVRSTSGPAMCPGRLERSPNASRSIAVEEASTCHRPRFGRPSET